MEQCIAVVGTGYWGRNHVRTWSALKEEGIISRLIVCDVDESRARELAEEFDCEWHTDALSLKEKYDISAATIATPTPMHAPLAIGLMEQGVDVLVEKPLAMNEAEAQSTVECAKTHGRLLCVGHLFRYHVAIRKAAEMISAGEIGPVLHIESERLSVREPRPDIGVIAALAIHDMDICRDLMGDIDPIEIDAFSLPSEIEGIEDHAVIHMRFPSGTCGNPLGPSAQITVSWRSRIRGKVRELRIIGRDASLHIDYLDHTGLWIHKHPNNARGPEWGGFGAAPRERVEIHGGEPSLTAELRAFSEANRAVKSGTPIDELNLLAPGEIGVIGMRLVESALNATKE
ncbi:MAG: Gfo/Idh/MocA family oxidoreductase [Candidatus Thermoplasmatota archaeon]|nr:Gfo/Idh/MocA family oxidoreductase [Candidatus Thermoplasmatota archaeon]